MGGMNFLGIFWLGHENMIFMPKGMKIVFSCPVFMPHTALVKVPKNFLNSKLGFKTV